MPVFVPPVNPTTTRSVHDYLVDLGGTSFRVKLRFDGRSQTWYLAIHDALDALLLDGIRLVVGFPLLLRFKTSGLPQGVLLLEDTSQGDEEALEDDLGNRCKLAFIPAEEVYRRGAADLGLSIT